MKPAVWKLFLLVALLFLSACRPGVPTQSNGTKTGSDPVPLAAAVIADLSDVLDMAVADNTAYLLTSDRVIRCDLATGERADLAEVSGGMAIAVDNAKLYIYGDNAILQLAEDGTSEKTIPCTFTPVSADRIAVSGNTLLLASRFENDTGFVEIALHTVNLATGECAVVPPSFKGSDGYSMILALDFTNAETAVITSLATTSHLYGVVKAYYFPLPVRTGKGRNAASVCGCVFV